jgi:hypothetical protein
MKKILLIFLFSLSSFALDVNVNGFVNLAYSGSDSSTVYNNNISNSGSFLNDSSAGLTFNSKINKNLYAQFQLMVDNIPERKEFRLYMHTATINYSHTKEIQFSFGKVLLPIWNFSDYRHVGALFPWLRPPEEVYSIFKGDNVIGGSVEYRKRFNSKLFNSLQIVAGSMSKEINKTPITQNGLETESTFSYDGPVVSINDSISIGKLKIRAAFSNLKFDTDVLSRTYKNDGVTRVVTETHLRLPRLNYNFYSLGLVYDPGFLSIQGELAQGDIDLDDSGNRLQQQLGGYLTIGKTISKLGVYLTGGYQELDKYVVPDISSSTEGSFKVSSLAIALNYSLSHNVLVKLQAKESKFYQGEGLNSSNLLGRNLTGTENITTYGASINAMF